MLTPDIISKNLKNTIEKTDFEFLGEKYEGKVRDNYTKNNKRFIIATDRISAFDVVLGSIPFRGQILTGMANFWFDKTKHITENHLLDVPDNNIMVTRLANPYPIEIIVRGYITGSAWRDYESGKDISGIHLKKGLRQYEKFDLPILTPSTKAEKGDHDMPISKEEIISKKLVAKKEYEQIENISLKLFELGSIIAKKQGLILVDTKYEFGKIDGNIVLIDEIHTPDSSRYWILDSYDETLKKEPMMLDKEFIRQWLISKHNYMGHGKAPKLSDEIKIEAALRYAKTYSQICGKEFVPNIEDPNKRMISNLKKGGYLG